MIYLVDDDADVRHALSVLLTNKGFEVSTYSSGERFLDSIGPNDRGCVVTDVRMPGISGVELLTRMKEARILIPVIVMTAYADVPLAIQVMKQGAIDLLEKPFTGEALVASINAACAKANNLQARDDEIREIQKRMATLTAREGEVLTGLLNGRANKMIAFNLGIGIRTVETHRATVMAKMKVESLAELVRLCSIGDAKRN
jgi:two-component system response regulator FixJ